ncbi:hypothetical protein CDAR_49631 [Caerostris darwini]|uniref:Uncharacterized protein n=1 Tax=Caerostris darwini TaxID=1538125 RepID=A0AAV4T5L4_9ARAC|nr:hypothetical protein CDAR_49631 [Caerostris darwini]
MNPEYFYLDSHLKKKIQVMTFIVNLSLSPSKTNSQSRKRDTRTPKELCTNYIKLRYSLRPNYRPVLIVSLHAVRLEYNTNIGARSKTGPYACLEDTPVTRRVHHHGP